MTLIENNTTSKFELYAFGTVLFLLSLSVVKISIASVGQLFMILFFIMLFLDSYRKKTIRWDVLFYMVGFGIILTLISLASPYPKIDGYKFIIKYILIFPIAYYIGVWAGENLQITQLSKILKVNMLLFVAIAIILYYFPISFLMHQRPLHMLRGTFFESGEFAMILAIFFLSALILDIDSKKKFDKKTIAIYIIVAIAMILTRNKTIWLAAIVIFLSFLIIKPFIINKKNLLPSSKKLLSLHPAKIIIGLSAIVILLLIINSLLPEPILSSAMIENKLHNERGKALLIALKLLSNSNWLGCYGFGYVQDYFSTYIGHVIGLNSNVGMIFNSYLDVWISVGILGVIYHLSLLYFGWNVRSLFTIAIPIYWFVTANTNPMSGSIYYFIFLGIAAGYSSYLKHKKEMI